MQLLDVRIFTAFIFFYIIKVFLLAIFRNFKNNLLFFLSEFRKKIYLYQRTSTLSVNPIYLRISTFKEQALISAVKESQSYLFFSNWYKLLCRELLSKLKLLYSRLG